MKKISVLCMIVALAFGVMGATCMQNVCNPTVEKKATVESYKAQATILLAFLRTQVSTPEVQAAAAGLQFAISVYDQVLAGVCMAVDVVTNADATVVANQKMARMKMGFRH